MQRKYACKNVSFMGWMSKNTAAEQNFISEWECRRRDTVELDRVVLQAFHLEDNINLKQTSFAFTFRPPEYLFIVAFKYKKTALMFLYIYIYIYYWEGYFSCSTGEYLYDVL